MFDHARTGADGRDTKAAISDEFFQLGWINGVWARRKDFNRIKTELGGSRERVRQPIPKDERTATGFFDETNGDR
jgi:hypothetical protein